MSEIVHVVAVLTTQPGERDAVLAEFAKIVPDVHAEDGCIEYQAVIDLPDVGPMQSPLGPDSYMVVEKWASLDALKAHAAAPHMKAFGAAGGGLIVDRKVHILSAT